MKQAFAILLLGCASTAGAVEHATITVDGAGAATKLHGSNDFFLDPGRVTGQQPIRIGTDASDDAAGGVLISAVSELDRAGTFATGATVRDSSPNSLATRNTPGALSVSSTKAGPAFPIDGGTPFDADLSAGYFPFAAGWQAGSLLSSTINNDATFGQLDTLVASGGIGLGTNVQTNFLGQPGVSKVTIPGVTDANRQGVLIASSASNVGRYQTVSPSLDGDGYIVRSVDNDGYFEFDPSLDPSTGGEGNAFDTPFSFAFVPVGTPGVTLGRVATHGNTSIEGEQVGVPLVKSGANWNVTSNNLTGPGRFRLEIDGFTPADGTLLVTPMGSTEDPGGRNADNVLTYEADATGWTILSQDIEADALYAGEGEVISLDGTGQASDGAEAYFNFVFLPNNAGPTAPGAIPSAASLTTFSKSRVIGWNTEVTSLSLDNNNDPGATAAMVAGNGSQQTSNLAIDQFANRGDIAVAVDGAFLNVRQGLLLTTVSEGFRDNSTNGGQAEYAVTMTAAFDQEWGVVTAAADNISGSDEHNVDYSAAFFGHDSGFRLTIGAGLEGEFGDPYETTKLDVDLPGVDALNDGVLIAAPFGNDDNFASATPKADGSGWEVRLFDNTYDANVDLRTEPDAASWVYLPYDAENLIAGRVDADGSLASSSPGAGEEWTLTAEDDGFGFVQYRLSFGDSGKGPQDGMLLLVGTGDADGSGGIEGRDNSMLYETDGNDFLIRGIDHVSDSQTDALVDFQETGFMFAYIDFENAPEAVTPQLLKGDFNNDGRVDSADYTVWRDNVGDPSEADLSWNGDGIRGIDQGDYDIWAANYGATLPLAATAVPEPSCLLLAVVGVAMAGGGRQRGGRV